MSIYQITGVSPDSAWITDNLAGTIISALPKNISKYLNKRYPDYVLVSEAVVLNCPESASAPVHRLANSHATDLSVICKVRLLFK